MATSALPSELWMIIFERIADLGVAHHDPRGLRSRAERNALLCSCALVCRAWTSPAQAVLFRNIQLGTKMSRRNGRLAGDTTESLQQVSCMLRQRVILPGLVRSLHLGMDVETTVHDAPAVYITHTGLYAVLDVIALCPQLVHLNLLIGATPGPEVPGSSLANYGPSIARALYSKTRLSHLTLSNIHNAGVCHDLGLSLPSATVAHQFIHALSSSLTLLDVRLTASDEQFVLLPSFPKLRELRCFSQSTELFTLTASLRAALRQQQCPALRRARLDSIDGALPSYIAHLSLRTSVGAEAVDADLSRFPALRHLEIDTGSGASVVRLLRSAAPTLRSLRIPVFALWSPDDAAALEAVLAGLPALERLVIIRRSPHVEFVMPLIAASINVVDDFDPSDLSPSPSDSSYSPAAV
ncbi:hypothetical protein AURDEDRAFT_165349 [Auricularia subglabra TFB-10046 SS5]|nr:hypothetical protein AURDEDRAFT_165349 [Auricularia subglabra TFB-10046 SS5]